MNVTVARFCEAAGISKRTFYRWKVIDLKKPAAEHRAPPVVTPPREDYIELEEARKWFERKGKQPKCPLA